MPRVASSKRKHPVFVIGKNRSGTKWLSNIVATHPRIVSVERAKDGGIIETNVFSRMPVLFGDLRLFHNRIAFLKCFSLTKFFHYTQLDKEVLFARKYDNYYDFFRYLMDSYAEANESDFWVQKAPPEGLSSLLRHFPDAKFILIERAVIENVRSTIGLRLMKCDTKFKIRLLSELFRWHHASKILRNNSGRLNVLKIGFDDLRSRREETVRRVCDFIGVEFDPAMNSDRYAKNSSFRQGGVSVEQAMPKRRVIAIRLLIPVFRALPWVFYEILHRTRTRFRGPRWLAYSESTFVPGAYSFDYIDRDRDGTA